jgi:hypothetical protein
VAVEEAAGARYASFRAERTIGSVTEVPAAASPTIAVRLRETLTDAIRYWEPRRLLFNGVLALIVAGYFVAGWPASKTSVTFDQALFFFILAVLANICYCAAYLGDVFVQLSGFRDVWHRWRWLLFTIGTLFAATITRFFAMGFFAVR